MKAWHYTIGDRVQSIFETGVLKAADAYVDPDEIPIVWFTTSDRWEPTANKMALDASGNVHTLTMEQTAIVGNGLYRFGYPIDKLIMWPELAERANMRSKVQRALEQSAVRSGSNPRKWCGALQPIPVGHMLGSVEQFVDGVWTPHA